MSYLRLSNKERREALFALAQEKTGLATDSSVGVMRGFVELMDSLLQDVYADLRFLELQLNVDTAEGFYLDNLGRMLDLKRHEETPTFMEFDVSLDLPTKKKLEIPKGAKVYTVHERSEEAGAISGKETGIELNAAETFRLDYEKGIIEGRLKLVTNVSGLESRPPENAVFVYARPGRELKEQTVEYEKIITPPLLGKDAWSDASYRQEIKQQWQLLIKGDVSTHYEVLAKSFVFDARIERILSTTYSTFTLWVSTKNGQPIAEAEIKSINDMLKKQKLITNRFVIKDAGHFGVGSPGTKDTVTVFYEIGVSVAMQGDIKQIARSYLNNLRIGERYYEAELYNRFDAAGIPSDSVHIDFTQPVVTPGKYERWIPELKIESKTTEKKE